ncbi:MAG TPA: hypothetical protein VFB33_01300 [Candidatus Binataceae bacterium]|nr:hypothetical protein [Candidatus Binataceae bacterium]
MALGAALSLVTVGFSTPLLTRHPLSASAAAAAEPFRFPAVLRTGKRVGDLIPGVTSLNDALRMFPAAPRDFPGNPRAPVSFPVAKLGDVQPEPTLVYNPPDTTYALFFDDNSKLVIIEDARPPLRGLGPREIHKRYPMLKDMGHDERVIELQGEVRPCVVMMVLFDAASRKVSAIAYAFTCATGAAQSTMRDPDGRLACRAAARGA